jgi:hypothetical protein
MANLKTLINELNSMVLEGKTMEAFEKFYADDVVMQENEQKPTVGKKENRKREEDFLNNLIDFRSARVLDVAVGDNVTMVKWAYDYTHKEWGTKDYTQIAVQHWRNGQIFKEQFFYGG